MKKASVFVSLSAYEGCPNAVMEAVACGCSIVLSDIAAHREILDESCARFVDPFNIHQTVDAIAQALCDVDTSEGRVLKVKQRLQEWSIVEMARKWEDIYRACI
jgi:glycosyltransferase involved in cell wall biosynthesis